jgi:hypothetical protein
MPGVSGVTVVTTLVCFFHFAHKAAGAIGARHSLRPLFSESGMFWQTSGVSGREIAGVRQFGLHPSRRGENAAPQDEVCQFLMVRSAATPRVSNHEART